MKKMLIVLVFLSLLPMIAWAGGKQEKIEDMELTVWHRWGESGARRDIYRASQDIIKARHPGITVKEVHVGGSYLEISQKIVADIAAGRTPPDMILAGFDQIEFMYRFIGAPTMNDIADSAELKRVTDKYIPAAIDSVTFDGKTLGLPFAFSSPVLYYNPEIFKAAGLDPDKPPARWAEVYEMSRKIREKTGKQGIYFQTIDSWPFNWMLRSNGAEILRGGKVAFNSPEGAEAMKTWSGFYQEGLAPNVDHQSGEASFIAGNIAMFWQSVMRVGGILKEAKFDVKTAKLPAFGNKPIAGPPGGAVFMILSRDKARQKASWRFMREMVSEEAMNTFIKTGYVSPLKGGKAVLAQQEPSVNTIPNLTAWPSWPGNNLLEIESVIRDWRDRFINGKVQDIPAGMEQFAAQIQKLLP